MNLLYFSRSPQLCAQQYCDKHLNKYLIELGVMLSTVLQHPYEVYTNKVASYIRTTPWYNNYKYDNTAKIIQLITIDTTVLYKYSHSYNPVVQWCMASTKNFEYAFDLFRELSYEYEYRFNKVHASAKRLLPTLQKSIHDILRVMKNLLQPLYLGIKRTYDFYFYAPPQLLNVKYRVDKGRGRFFRDKKIMIEFASLATIKAYRQYYYENFKDAKWTKRSRPSWFDYRVIDLDLTHFDLSNLAKLKPVVLNFPENMSAAMRRKASIVQRAQHRKAWEDFSQRRELRRAIAAPF